MTSREVANRPSHRGRRVLVTGAGQGIGAAIALAFGRRGAAVAVVDIELGRAEEIAKRIHEAGGKAVAAECDVAKYDELAKACGELQDSLGGSIDTIINNAGISPKHNGLAHRLWEMAPDEWQRVLSVNLAGASHTIRLLAPAMREARFGAIVNMSSVAGKTYSEVVGALCRVKGGPDWAHQTCRRRTRTVWHPRQRHCDGADRDTANPYRLRARE
jgi:3-oxoacyl-[acyl-carrier protein] reductase